MSDLASRNQGLMRRVYEEMWNAGNPAVAVELFAQPEGVERFVNQFLASFPDLQHTTEEMIVDGERVAVRFSARGTHTGTWMNFAPTISRMPCSSTITLDRGPNTCANFAVLCSRWRGSGALRYRST